MDAVSMRDFLVRLGYTGRYGHDGFPDSGDLTKHFREKRGKSQEWLAEKLGCSRVMVTRMENEGLGMDNIYTRREIAKYLSITPALFGLVSKDDLDTKVLYDTTILRTALKMHREVYFSTGLIGGISEVDDMLHRIAKISEGLNHKNREVLEILCQYYQLGIDIGREEQNYKAVTEYAAQAMGIAERLKDPILTLTTLIRLSDALYDAGDFVQAKHYANMGLDEIRTKDTSVFDSKPKVPSHIIALLYLGIGRTYAATDEPKAMQYLNSATTIARRKTKEEDVGFVRLTTGFCYLRTAYALIDQQQYEEALKALEQADKETAPNLMRRKVAIQVLQAKVYLKQKNYEWSAQVASTALDTASIIHALPNIAHLAAIHIELSKKWGTSDNVLELGTKLKTATGDKKLLLPSL